MAVEVDRSSRVPQILDLDVSSVDSPLSSSEVARIMDLQARLPLICEAASNQFDIINPKLLVAGKEQQIEGTRVPLSLEGFYQQLDRQYPQDLSTGASSALEDLFWATVSPQLQWDFEREGRRLGRSEKFTDEEKGKYTMTAGEIAGMGMLIDIKYGEETWDELGNEVREMRFHLPKIKTVYKKESGRGNVSSSGRK